MSNETIEQVSKAECQSWIDHAVGEQQERHRTLFVAFGLVIAERDKYKAALEALCERGRCPIAEKALGLNA